MLTVLRWLALPLAALLAASLLGGSSVAATVTFTHAGFAAGGGSIGEVDFGPADFIITAIGNTDDREDAFGGLSIDHRSARIEIDGVGRFDFITPTRTFGNGAYLVGFSRGLGAGGSDLFNGPASAAFASYDLTQSIGPISGVGELVQWDLAPIQTSGGVLVLEDGTSTARFSANVAPIPLPAGGFLLLVGLLALPLVALCRPAS